jgi:para-aminobenzoate synthetase component 1
LRRDPFVLFRDDLDGSALGFADPIELICVEEPADFTAALAHMDRLRAAGKYLAGYMSYEAGYLFEPKLAAQFPKNRRSPLMCFGVFDAPLEDDPRLLAPANLPVPNDLLIDPKALWDFATYQEKFERLHYHLRQGNCYQANLTMPVHARWSGDPLAAFWALIERQPVRYGAYVDLAGPRLISRSPELFFAKNADGWIETHPMKGTAKRGTSLDQDQEIIASMLADDKTLAENRMIVDLLRNDISRITEVGSLSVPKLFEIESYPTVHQMVSHVRGKLLAEASLFEIFESLFPCGSVTGAPKMWAMDILRALEAAPRDVYCGAIGYIKPNGEMQFNVPIRTLSLYDGGEAIFNVGGGIVIDSNAQSEYEECLLKAKFAVGERQIAKSPKG